MENSCVLKRIDLEGQYQVNKAFRFIFLSLSMWRAHVKPAAVPGRHWCDHGAVLCNHTTQKARWELSCLIPCSAQKQPGTEESWGHLSVSFHHSMSGKMWLTSQRWWSNRIPERSTANWIDFVVMVVRTSLVDRLIVKVTTACPAGLSSGDAGCASALSSACR